MNATDQKKPSKRCIFLYSHSSTTAACLQGKQNKRCFYVTYGVYLNFTKETTGLNARPVSQPWGHYILATQQSQVLHVSGFLAKASIHQILQQEIPNPQDIVWIWPVACLELLAQVELCGRACWPTACAEPSPLRATTSHYLLQPLMFGEGIIESYRKQASKKRVGLKKW